MQKIKEEILSLEKQEQDPAVYSSPIKAKQIGRTKRQTQDLLDLIEETSSIVFYFDELLIGFSDEELIAMSADQEVDKLMTMVENLYVQTLYSQKWDNNDCILEIHAGAGGEEAQDWAEMLYRMYFRYANIQGYDVKLIDSLPGTGAGYKSVTMMISGTHAYGNLINEKGVHRLVRISPFDANKRRHTSFASVDVSPVIDDDEPIEIKADELKIDTYRAGGAGGQHVNKTESAVRITHLPTGIVVQCQNERSQLQNKEFAMKMLSSKLAQLKQEKLDEEKAKEKSLDKKIEWGSQIRSYVLHPYNMVKDHRTKHQTSNTTAVLDGAIQDFIVANLVEKNN